VHRLLARDQPDDLPDARAYNLWTDFLERHLA
jgi:hypothetical protein